MSVSAKENITTKKRILLSARKEFANKGFAGARMQSIAGLAKINKAMIYYYFKDKEKLHLAVLNDLFEVKDFQKLRDNMEKLNLSSHVEKLCAAIYIFVRLQFNDSYEDKHQIIAWEIAEGRKNLRCLVRDIFIPHIERFESLIEAGIKENSFSTEYPLLTVMNIIWFVISYRINEFNYQGSMLYERLYQKDQEENIFQFISEHTLSSIQNPKQKAPTLNQNIIKKIDECIKEQFE